MDDPALYDDLRVALRVVHTRLAGLKLRFERDDREFGRAIVQLRDHLTILIYPFAYRLAKRKSWAAGGYEDDVEAESLAGEMAAVGMGRILRCSVSFVSLGIEEGSLLRYWWMDVLKKQRRISPAGAARADDAAARPDPTPDVPLPLVWLRALLRLSRRSWIYLALAEARDEGHKGRLSDRYLGRNRSGGSRQSRLSELIGEWDLVEPQLIAASRREDEAPRDAVASFVQDLEDLPADAGGRDVLAALIEAAGAGLGSTSFPDLAGALRRAAGRFGRIEKARPGLVCEALAQFVKETDRPETWPGHADRLEALLTELPRDVGLEREPADVLRAFAEQAIPADPRIPVLHPVVGRERREQRRPEDHVRLSDRFALGFAQFGRDDPEADVIVQSGIGEPLDDLAGRLAGYLDGPDQLSPNLLEEMRVILKDWVDRLDSSGADPTAPRTRLRRLCLDAECRSFVDSPRNICESLGVVESWADGGFRPGSWSDLDEVPRAVLLKALSIALVTRVHEALRRIYLADKQFRNESYDAPDLIESVMGRDWGEPDLEPEPGEVRKRLEEKARDARIRVMVVAALPGGGSVTGDSTGNVCAWDLDGASGLKMVASHRPRTSAKTVFAIEVFPSGIVAASHANGTVTLWHPLLDPGAEKVVTLDEPDGPVLALARLGDDLLAAGDGRGQVVVWKVGLITVDPSPPEEASGLIEGARLHRKDLHTCPVRGLATVGPSILFAGAECGDILGWDLATGGVALAGFGDRGFHRLAASPPATLASSGRDRWVRIRDVAGWLDRDYDEGVIRHEHQCSRSTGVIHPVNGRVLAGSGTEVVAIDLTRNSTDTIIDHGDLVTGIAPAGDRVYSTGLDGTLRASGNPTPLHEQPAPLRCLAVLEGAGAVALGDDEGSVVLVEPATGRVRTARCPPRPTQK